MVIFLSDAQIGERIKQKRLAKGWTQTDLGNKLGVGAAAVNKWELGKVTNIKRDILQGLVLELGIHPATLIGIDPEPQEFVISHHDYTVPEMREIANYLKFIKMKRSENDQES